MASLSITTVGVLEGGVGNGHVLYQIEVRKALHHHHYQPLGPLSSAM